MEHSRHNSVTDEQRREFLRVLDVGGTVAAGCVALDDVRSAIASESSDELASVGETIQSKLTGALDAGLLARAQAEFAETAAALTQVPAKGLPTARTEPREEFESVAIAARPIYDHLDDVGSSRAPPTPCRSSLRPTSKTACGGSSPPSRLPHRCRTSASRKPNRPTC